VTLARRIARVVACLLFALGVAGMAAAQGGRVVNVATISGQINGAAADYLAKAIAQSEREGVEALVIELDTPGGRLDSTKDIVSSILNAKLPVVVFVSPRGAYAASAGTFITLAGNVAAMAPGTSIGAAHPVPMFGTPPPPLPTPEEEGKEPQPGAPPPDVMAEKIENFTAAFIQSIAEARDRNVEWAIEAVRKSVAITQRQALEKNVVDLLAEDLDDLLQKINGREVSIGGEKRTLATADARVVRIEMTALNRFFDVLGDPQIAILLVLGGLLGLYVEFNNPGMILPGVLGLCSLVLGALALQLIPFNWFGLMLILAGVVLMVVELFTATFGILFGIGVLCMAVGGYLIFDVPELGDMSVPFFSVTLPAVATFAALGGGVVFAVSRTMFQAPATGVEGMVGQLATVDTDIDPVGRVLLRGELWTAEASEPLRRGEQVRIREVRDLVLRVSRPTDAVKES
jgi:membrane-bound serine protease (ClpP class)